MTTETNPVWHKGLPFSARVAPFLRHMPLVEAHREALLRLQGVWDTLSLMGQMSGAATDIAQTRTAFQELTATMLDSLARRQLEHATERLRGKAQVTIDILVRNLFERTADVGFLASDEPLRAHVTLSTDDPQQLASRASLQARFRAYVAKYSVYDDIVVLSARGEVLAQLDDSSAATHCAELWVFEALRGGQPYFERYGATTLLGGREGLIYATTIQTPQGVGGLLCLSFKLADEMDSVFRQLLGADARTVICLLDAHDRVLQTSDPWQLPVGAKLGGSDTRVVFAGRDYLGADAGASGYEGYMGPPGWRARALVPLEWAFEGEGQASDGEFAASLAQLSESLDTSTLFDAELRGIPLQAQRIQRNLSRSLWNGKLRSRTQTDATGTSSAFAVTLLNEVQRTGEQLRLLFEQAIGNLQHSTLAAVFDGALFQARLAIDIMDRNLYERANDCRWWALDTRLQQALAGGPATHGQAQAVLARINSLYTVYSLLLVFDLQGEVVAVSDTAQAHHVGRRLSGAWVGAALNLRDRKRYVVSRHEATSLYAGADGDQPTYVYATALQHEGQVVGGIAIVFDGEPQFAAMLRDAVDDTAIGLFATREGRVVSSTDARWPVGSQAPLPVDQLDLAAGETRRRVEQIDGVAYAVGIALSQGYREYRRGQAPGGEDVAAIVMQPLGSRLQRSGNLTALAFSPPTRGASEERLDVASFNVCGQWLGLPAGELVEALEQPRIALLPNAPRTLVGMLEHDGRMLPVLDLGILLFGRPCNAADAPVIICRPARGGSSGLAVRVDELGPVFPVGVSHIQPSPTRAGRERLVRGGLETPGALLTLLSVDELWAQVNPAAWS